MPQGKNYSHFYHQRLILFILELHLNEIIPCTLFCLTYLAQRVNEIRP